MFEVDWDTRATDQLALLWIQSKDREAIVLVSEEIDRILELDPCNAGESRQDKNHRVLILGPLMVYFLIHEAEKSVTVTLCFPSRT